MSKSAFNLTAEINLRGPSNLNKVVSNIRNQLSGVSLDLKINPNTSKGIQTATTQVQALSAALQTATANANSLNASMSNLGRAISSASGGTSSLSNGLKNAGNQVASINKNAQQAAVGMEEFGRQSSLAVRRFAAFTVATGGIYTLVRAITSGFSEFVNFNKELIRLQQVTGATQSSLKGISDEITRLSTGFGVASSDLLKVSTTLAQAGLSASQTKTTLDALAKSALAPSFDNLNDTVEGSIALMRQFSLSSGDLEASLGSINAVAASFAVEAGDIIKAIQRTGGVFAAASKGVTEGKDALNEFVALFTSVRQTTRESAETIATGLRTIFTRIQRGSTIEALKEYGISLTDLEGKFVGPFEAVKRLSEGLKNLDPRDVRFSKIVEELGGFRQIGKVIPLIQEFETAQRALSVAQKGSGSLADAAAVAQLSLANKITKVREEFVALIRDIGQSKSFQKFADLSLQLASALISVASAAKDVLPALTALAAIKAIPAIGQFVGGFGRGLQRKNKGGYIKQFASGGYVPGSGNRDTVPAMLTPGEFVIRKKAVEKIGVNKLAKINRDGGGPVPAQYFNSGGLVQRFAQKRPKPGSGNVKQTSSKWKRGAKVSVGVIDKNEADKNIDQESIIKPDLIRASAKLAKNLGQNQIKPNKINNIANFKSVSGSIFETALDSLTTGNFSRSGDTANFDFRSGLGANVSRLFARSSERSVIASSPTDAKRNADSGFLKNDLTKKIINENKKGRTNYGVAALVGKPKTINITANDLNSFNLQKKTGGLIQKFNKGGAVSPADLLVGPGGIEAGVWRGIKQKALNARKLALGEDGRSIIFPDGQQIDFKKALDANPNVAVRTALSSVGIRPGQLRQEFTELYSKQRAGVVAATGDRSSKDIKTAMSQKLLFGAAGMFGRRFNPRPLKLKTSDGLKQDMDAVVFGSVLDRDNITKRARLEKRKMLFQAAGSPGGTDAGAIDIAAAPTAEQLTRSFQKESSSVVGKQNKTLAKNYVQAIASSLSPSTGGSKIFLDFDKTLAFGADKIAAKIKGKKNPDYSAFGDTSKVAGGLSKAKLSGLGIRIKKILSTLDQQEPGLSRELLNRMFVVSARPQRTMPLIARWIRNQGIRIPPSNVLGVGGGNVPTGEVGLRKAEAVARLGLSSGGVFIDDDPSNVAAVRDKLKNIRSIEYGYSPDKSDKKVRQQIAVQEGYQFEKYINERLPKNLKTAIFQKEGEGIDFPFGLDANTAKYWFNDMRLVGVPVDTKRTITGPSTIKSNVISYLKQKGFADGGLVQKFSNGEYVEGSAMKALRAMVREFLMPRSRKGGLRKISFTGQKAVSISKNISPDLLKEIEKEGRLVYGTGIGDIPKGDPGLLVDRVINVALAKVKQKKAGQLKKTQGALTFSAAGLQRGPRAPAGQMEKALAQYQKDPQYRAAMGLDSGVAGGFLKQFEALAKVKKFTSPKTLLDKLPGAKKQISEFRASLQQQLKRSTDPKETKSLQDQIKKSTTALDDFDDYMMGAAPRNAGRASHFAWAMRQAVPGSANFAFGGKVEGPGFEEIRQQIINKYPSIQFRISKRKRGFGYNLMGALKSKGGLSGDSGLNFQQPTNLKQLQEYSDKLASKLMSPERLASGGKVNRFAKGEMVPALVSNGEAYVPPSVAKKIGRSKLDKMNQADRNGMTGFSKGGISVFEGPGTGISDSIRTDLPVGSYILREKATKALGLNKGGSVGNIQSFAGGGKVSPFSLSFPWMKAFANAIGSTSSYLINFKQATAQAAVSAKKMAAQQQVAAFRQQGLKGPVLKGAMIGAGFGKGGSGGKSGGGEGMGGMGAMGLMFIGPMIAEAINSSLFAGRGSAGAQAGSILTSTISGATIGSFGGPWGALAGAVVGVTSGILNMEKAANQYIKSQNDLIIDSVASSLEKNLEKLSNKASLTADDIALLSSNINTIMSLGASNREIVGKEAQGMLGFQDGSWAKYFAAGFRDTFGKGIDYASEIFVGGSLGSAKDVLNPVNVPNLSKELLSLYQPDISALTRSISVSLEKGLSFEEMSKQLNFDSPEVRRTLAVAQGGGDITRLEAEIRRIETARYDARDRPGQERSRFWLANLPQELLGTGKETKEEVEARRQRDIERVRETLGVEESRLFEEYTKNLEAAEKAARAIKEVSIEIDLFAQNVKNLEAAVGRAKSEFDESLRIRDIQTGVGLGDAKIVGPSRLDENILDNLRGYSREEVLGALGRTSETLGFSPEFAERVKTATVAQQTLEQKLPEILLRAAQTQREATGDEEIDIGIKDQLAEVFDKLKEAVGDEIDVTALNKYTDDIVKALARASGSLKGKSLTEIVEAAPQLESILKPLSDITKTVSGSLKEYNGILTAVSGEMNAYTGHLSRILELQMKAASIQLEGATSLKEALGEEVTLSERNRPFETMIDTLTSQQGPRGLVRGTGTTDPAEIERRLSKANRDFVQADLDKPGAGADQAKIDAWTERVSRSKNVVDRLSKAQEELANNTTRASNALSRIRELRQAQEGRRNTFDDILRNLNNPEWLIDFTNQVASLERVTAGRGNVMDIGPALDAFKTRLSGIDPQLREEQTKNFYNEILRILGPGLANDPMSGAILNAVRQSLGLDGPDAEMMDAIRQHEKAIRDQAAANALMAERMNGASNLFYNKVVEAAEAFLKRVGEGAQLPDKPNNAAPNAGAQARGGLIYASKGQLINFQPKGTDTVPAMLTPGEFVVNRAATQKNLPLLKSINNNSYSDGGVVYLQGGGLAGLTPAQRKAKRRALSVIPPELLSETQREELEELQEEFLSGLNPQQIANRERAARIAANAASPIKRRNQPTQEEINSEDLSKVTNETTDPSQIEQMLIEKRGEELAKKFGWSIKNREVRNGTVMGEYEGYEPGEEPLSVRQLGREDSRILMEYQNRQWSELGAKEREKANIEWQEQRDKQEAVERENRRKQIEIEFAQKEQRKKEEEDARAAIVAQDMERIRAEIDAKVAARMEQRRIEEENAPSSRWGGDGLGMGNAAYKREQKEQEEIRRKNLEERKRQQAIDLAISDSSSKMTEDGAELSLEQKAKLMQEQLGNPVAVNAETDNLARRLNDIISASKYEIYNQTQEKSKSGVFGFLRRSYTFSDPYEEIIRNEKRKLASATTILRELNEARNGSIQERIDINNRTLSGIQTLLRSDMMGGGRELFEEMMKNEQEAINLTRDAVIDITTSFIPAGAAAKGLGLAAKGASAAYKAGTATRLGFQAGAKYGTAAGITRGVDTNLDINRGQFRYDPAAGGSEGQIRDITATEAVQGILSQTAKEATVGAVGGAAFGGALSGAGSLLGKAMATKAGQSVIGLGKRAVGTIYEKLPKSLKDVDSWLIRKISGMEPDAYYRQEALKQAAQDAKAIAQQERLEKALQPTAEAITTKARSLWEGIIGGPARGTSNPFAAKALQYSRYQQPMMENVGRGVGRGLMGGGDLAGKGLMGAGRGLMGAAGRLLGFEKSPTLKLLRKTLGIEDLFKTDWMKVQAAKTAKAQRAAQKATTTAPQSYVTKAGDFFGEMMGGSIQGLTNFAKRGLGTIGQKAKVLAGDTFGRMGESIKGMIGGGRNSYLSNLDRMYMSMNQMTGQKQKGLLPSGGYGKFLMRKARKGRELTQERLTEIGESRVEQINRRNYGDALQDEDGSRFGFFGLNKREMFTARSRLRMDLRAGKKTTNEVLGRTDWEDAFLLAREAREVGQLDAATRRTNILRSRSPQKQVKVSGFDEEAQKAGDILFRAQSDVRDILVEYSSSPAKARKILTDQSKLFNVSELAVDPALQKKINVVSGGNVGGEYNPYTQRISVPAKDKITPGIARHEALHDFQKNAAVLQKEKDVFRWFRGDSLKELEPQMKKFLKSGGAYDKLISDLSGSVEGAGFYSGADILGVGPNTGLSIPGKNPAHFELLTSLATAGKTKAFKNNKEAQDMLRAIIKAMGYERGGIVYASKGTLVPYQPKGTDTVPAMLTPGEFVVNAKSAKKNMGLLKAINGGAKGYSKGGVAYLEGGGRVRTRKDLEEEIEAKRKEREEIKSTAAKRRDEYRYGDEYQQDIARAKALVIAEETASFRGLLASLSGGVDNENLNGKLDEFRSESSVRIAEKIYDKTNDTIGKRVTGLEYRAGSFSELDDSLKQQHIKEALNDIVNPNIDQFKASPWDYSVASEEFQNKLDDRIAHGSLVEYKLTDNAGEVRPQPNVGGGYTSDANQRHYQLGHEIKDSQNLLRDIDLLQDKPNAQNEARITYTSAKITLEDMGIDTTYFGGGFTTGEIQKGLESPDFEAKAAQNKARAIQQLKQRAEENLIANNIDWKEAKKEDPPRIPDRPAWPERGMPDQVALPPPTVTPPANTSAPELSELTKTSLKIIQDNIERLTDGDAAQAHNAATNINHELNSLKGQGFDIHADGIPDIGDILNASKNDILEARQKSRYINNNLSRFYDSLQESIQNQNRGNVGVMPNNNVVPPDPAQLAAEQIDRMIADATVSPDYYDEPTYREFIKKLVGGNPPQAPVPPEQSKFITDARTTKDGLRFTGLDIRNKGEKIKPEEDQEAGYIESLKSIYLKIKGLDDVRSQLLTQSQTSNPEQDPLKTQIETFLNSVKEPINDIWSIRRTREAENDEAFAAFGEEFDKEYSLEDFKNKSLQQYLGLSGRNLDLSIKPRRKDDLFAESLDTITKDYKESGLITGYKSAYSQYQDSLKFYKVQRGKFNYASMQENKKQNYQEQKRMLASNYQNEKERRRRAAGFATGGMVYANKGQLINFQPRGTDTVPAMLTPGEFVVNKKATKNNLNLLKRINDNNVSSAKLYNTGGVVTPNYYTEGGRATSAGSSSLGNGVLSVDTSDLDSAFSTFGGHVQSLDGIISRLSNFGNNISQALSGLDLSSGFTALASAASLLGGSSEGFTRAISLFNNSVGRLDSALSQIPDSISLNVSGSIPVNVTVTVNGGEGLGEQLETFKDQLYNEISAGITNATQGKLKIDLRTTKK